jgi:hypothetical protein
VRLQCFSDRFELRAVQISEQKAHGSYVIFTAAVKIASIDHPKNARPLSLETGQLGGMLVNGAMKNASQASLGWRIIERLQRDQRV